MTLPIAPTDGQYLWDETAQKWIKVPLDEFGFPATPERREALRQYENWVWSDEVGNWVPPSPKPDPIMSPDNPEWVDAVFVWDDNAVAWVAKSTKPYPSWVRAQDGQWMAPVPYPGSGDWIWNEDTLSWAAATD